MAIKLAKGAEHKTDHDIRDTSCTACDNRHRADAAVKDANQMHSAQSLGALSRLACCQSQCVPLALTIGKARRHPQRLKVANKRVCFSAAAGVLLVAETVRSLYYTEPREIPVFCPPIHFNPSTTPRLETQIQTLSCDWAASTNNTGC